MLNFKRFGIISTLFLFSRLLYAQPAGPPGGGTGGPSGGTGNPPCWPPGSCVSIDNGIIFLLIAGLLYGAYILYKYNKAIRV